MPFNTDEREQMLENYEKSQGFAPVDDTDTSTETEEETETPSEETEDAETLTEETEEAEASDETEEADDESEAEDGVKKGAVDEKMVPYGALHEEREKRKGLSKKVEILETQLNEVLQDYRKVAESRDEETDDMADPEIANLKRELAELKQFRNEMTQKDQQASARAQQDELTRSVEETDKKLEKDGYPGFIYTTDAVAREIAKMVKDDPENAYLYSPEGWYKVYSEVVFPKVESKFSNLHKSKLFEKKEKLKSKQKLVGKVGKKAAPEKSDQDWDYTDYIKFRKEQSFA